MTEIVEMMEATREEKLRIVKENHHKRCSSNSKKRRQTEKYGPDMVQGRQNC